MEIHAIKTYCTNKECWQVELVYEDKLETWKRKMRNNKIKTKKIEEYYFDRKNWRPPSISETARKLGVSKGFVHKVVHKYGENKN